MKLKRQKLEVLITSPPETNCDAPESDGYQSSSAPSEGMLTEEEDSYPFATEQPETGLKEEKRTPHDSSKTRKSSYNEDDIKTRRGEKKELSTRIPITQPAKPVWGDIRTAFKSISSAPTQSSEPSNGSEQPPPADLVAPTLTVSPKSASFERISDSPSHSSQLH
jgi:hypothetical protein